MSLSGRAWRIAVVTMFAAVSAFGCDASCPAGTTQKNGLCVRPDNAMQPQTSEVSAGEGGSTRAPDAPTAGKGEAGRPMKTGSASGTGGEAASPKAGDGAQPLAGKKADVNPEPVVMVTAGASGTGGTPLGTAGDPATLPSGGAGETSQPATAGGAGAGGMSEPPAADGGAGGSPPSCTPVAETCDNADNDCDGKIDEDVTRDCGASNKPPCKLGKLACKAGQWGDEATQCQGAVLPKAEICDAAKQDENCDGRANEQCDCNAGDTMPCGACMKGRAACVNGKISSDCQGDFSSTQEVCDGIDNDCDGTRDNGDDKLCSNGEHCAGAMKCVQCLNATTCPHGACTVAICDGGGCSTGPAKMGIPCQENGGRKCDAGGKCVPCNVPADCGTPPDSCHEYECMNNRCDSKVKNGKSCGDKMTCNITGMCINNCGNGVLDQGEGCESTNEYICDPKTCTVRSYYKACTSADQCSGDSVCGTTLSKRCLKACSGADGSNCSDWFGSAGGCTQGSCLLRCSDTNPCPASLSCTQPTPFTTEKFCL